MCCPPVVVQAVFRIGSRALKNKLIISMSTAAFVTISFLHIPSPLIIIAAGIAGYLGGETGMAAFKAGGGHNAGSGKNRCSGIV